MAALRRVGATRRWLSTWFSPPINLADRMRTPLNWQAGAPPSPHAMAAAAFAPAHFHGGGSRSDGATTPPSAALVPYVVETTSRGERGYDIFSRLLVDRIICVNGPIDDYTASIVVAQLLYLDSLSHETPIHMYINSPGGVVTAGLAIYDAMQFVGSPVSTLCVGQACSMASLLLCAGSKGLRRALPNARVMVHQPHGGVSGQASDIQIHTREMLQLKANLYSLFRTHTGRTLPELESALDRDCFMSGAEAMAFGLIDTVVIPHKTAQAPAAPPAAAS